MYNITVIGSRIFSDAIAYGEGLKCRNRIVGISPLVICDSFSVKNADLSGIVGTDYAKLMLNYELTKSFPDAHERNSCDALVFDLLDLRLSVVEFTLSTKETFYLTNSSIYKENSKSIKSIIEKSTGKKIERERVVIPKEFTPERLSIELNKLVGYYKNFNKVIALENKCIYNYIDNGGNICLIDDINECVELNAFYAKCYEILREHSIAIVPAPEFAIGDERERTVDRYNYCREIYAYYHRCVLDYIDNSYSVNKFPSYKANTDNAVMRKVGRINARRIAASLSKRRKDREVVIIGDDGITAEILEKENNITPSAIIRYDRDTENYELESELQAYKDQSEIYVFVVPKFYRGNDLIKILWEYGYALNTDVISVTHNEFRFSGFTGEYNDIFDNRISVCSPVDIAFGGMAEEVIIPKSAQKIVCNIRIVSHQAKIQFGNNIKGDKTLAINAYACSRITIGDGTTFADNCIIRATHLSEITIGKDCMFSSKVVFFGGDAHGIFDLETGRNVSLQVGEGTTKNKIVIENHVWVGYESFILSKTVLRSGSVVAARSLTNREYPNNCIIAGQPASIKKKNIYWDRDPFLKNINSSNIDPYLLRDTEEDQ